jgi:predicted metal-binding membrane protein
MGLLFIGGVMNVLWIAAITIFVFLEKILPAAIFGGRLKSLAGLGMIISGCVILASWLAGRASLG